jgi:Fe-S-cluster containining protein
MECKLGCGWCCNNINMPVPTNEFFTLERMIELLRTQGHTIYCEPGDDLWYVIINKPCVHYDTETTKCRIHNQPRPWLCSNWVCHDPGNMIEYYDNLVKEGEEYGNRIRNRWGVNKRRGKK